MSSVGISARELIEHIRENTETQIFNLVDYNDDIHKSYLYLEIWFASNMCWITNVVSRRPIRRYINDTHGTLNDS